MWRGAMKWAAALALAAALAQPAWAGPGASWRGQKAANLSRFYEMAANWLAAGWHTMVAELTSDRGSQSDPDGATATTDSDAGSSPDPNGTIATADSDRGSVIDPDG